MRRASGVVVGFVVSCTAAEAGAEGMSFLVRPEFGIQGGIETYELSLPIEVPQSSVTVTASSKLSYPVSTLLAGGSLVLGTGPFSFEATALTNLIDPWGTLVDQDFSSTSSHPETVEFSHTDSRTTLRALALEAAFRLRIVELSRQPGQVPLHLVAGLRYEWSSYDAYGASGWRLDNMQNEVPFSIPGDPLALHYDVRYWLPFVGGGVDFAFGKRFSLHTEARFLFSWSTHDDDHVLRHKVAHSLAHGAGFALAIDPALEVAGGAVARLFIGLSGQLQFVGALDGKLSQTYYADDPSLPGDPAGVALPDSNFSFTSLRARLLAFAAVRF